MKNTHHCDYCNRDLKCDLDGLHLTEDIEAHAEYFQTCEEIERLYEPSGELENNHRECSACMADRWAEEAFYEREGYYGY